ncbi:MAG: lipoyl domain-containing protein, partial [Caldilineaceae bacterium]|nr:lipoyl domain-containing protein [Caldilineaceae bacterium]
MATQVILPKLTYEMEEGRIVEWLCEEGNAVDAGQALFVVETDKASIEVQAEEAGILLRVLVPT